MWTRRLSTKMGLEQEEFNEIFMRALSNELVNQKLQSVISTELKNELGLLRDVMKKKEDKIIELEKKVEALEVKLDDMEQYSRRNKPRVSGIPETDSEDLNKKVTELINDKLQATPPVTLGQIDRVHRVGKKKENTPRAILVKFSTYNVRDKVFRSKKVLRTKALEAGERQQIYINEDLTQKRSKLLWQARKFKSDKRISDCWSWDGNILIKDKNSRILPVCTLTELQTVAV